ncbi:MAG: ribosome biogenesis GTP-binding protein YihA/YsxC [Pseudomonadota bacterium]
MDRLQTTFLTSAPGLRQAPRDEVAEIAFAGRSNAGKSSVLNCISGNKRMAKVSKTPGRTQLLNFFDVVVPGEDTTHGRIVDLPGYGYAKAGKQAQAQWQRAVNDYLNRRDNLTAVVLVMDIRHPNQAFDKELIQWANDSELPIRILLNKMDKLGFGKAQNALRQLTAEYRSHPLFTAQIFSALKTTGRAELIDYALEQFCAR